MTLFVPISFPLLSSLLCACYFWLYLFNCALFPLMTTTDISNTVCVCDCVGPKHLLSEPFDLWRERNSKATTKPPTCRIGTYGRKNRKWPKEKRGRRAEIEMSADRAEGVNCEEEEQNRQTDYRDKEEVVDSIATSHTQTISSSLLLSKLIFTRY